MKLAKVIGRVVLSKKDESLPNGFLAILSPLQKSAVYDLNAETASAGEPLSSLRTTQTGRFPEIQLRTLKGRKLLRHSILPRPSMRIASESSKK